MKVKIIMIILIILLSIFIYKLANTDNTEKYISDMQSKFNEIKNSDNYTLTRIQRDENNNVVDEMVTYMYEGKVKEVYKSDEHISVYYEEEKLFLSEKTGVYINKAVLSLSILESNLKNYIELIQMGEATIVEEGKYYIISMQTRNLSTGEEEDTEYHFDKEIGIVTKQITNGIVYFTDEIVFNNTTKEDVELQDISDFEIIDLENN